MVVSVLAAEQQWWGAPWPDALLALSAGVVAIGVLVGVVVALSARRAVGDAARTRRGELCVELLERWESRGLREVRAETAEMTPEQFQEHMRSLWRAPGEPQWQVHRRRQLQIGSLGNFFEDLGVLASFGSLDLDWIDECLGDASLTYWSMWVLHVQEQRGRANSELLFRNWQHLARRIEERRARQGSTAVTNANWQRRLQAW